MNLNQIRLALNRQFRRFFYNHIYYSDWLTGDLRFFNLGVAPVDSGIVSTLPFPDEQHQAQVYVEAIKAFRRHSANLAPNRVLEVSTGLGGGLLVLSHCFPAASIFGLDYARASIRRSRRTLPDAALTVADAQAAPFKDSSFALIVNVESFHAVDAGRFFSEARRFLTADGLLIIIDFRKAPAARLQHWVTEQAEAAGMIVVEFLDLTRNAIASARSDAPRRNRLLKRIPLPFKKLANEMTAGEGSDLLKQYLAGEKTYFLCVLKSANIQIDR
jgi:ubiquinone/menaquinone biosynthesis C-methylase UbiE